MLSKFTTALLIALAVLLGACTKPEPPTINLYRAVHISDIDQIERNLRWGADVNQPGPDGLTALHVAAGKGSLVIVKMLLQEGADPELKDPQGNTPLSTALLTRNTLVAGYLVKQGVPLDPNAILQKAVRQGQADRDVIDFLVKRGAELDRQDPQGNPALHLAILNGRRVIAKYLINKGADINLVNSAGKSPLALANELGEKDIERMLIDFGAVITP
jgi:ankyrin repeat protein